MGAGPRVPGDRPDLVERKARNLEGSQHVVLTSTDQNALHEGLDLVVEGEALRVTDDARLRRLADAWVDKYTEEWRFAVRDGAFFQGNGTAGDRRPRTRLGVRRGAHHRLRLPPRDLHPDPLPLLNHRKIPLRVDDAAACRADAAAMSLLLNLFGWLLIDALPELLPWRRVPDVMGQRGDSAELLLYGIPFEVVAEGPADGQVVLQHPPPGTRLRRNQRVTIVLAHPQVPPAIVV